MAKIQIQKSKIILRVNECDARKGTHNVDNLWIECSKYVDKTVFVSNWIKDYFFKKGWHCKDSAVIYNGVNIEHFKEREKIENKTCTTCWRMLKDGEITTINGEPTCDRCSAKHLKYAFGGFKYSK